MYTRRMIEKGVRFIQVWHGEGQPWDSHSEIEKNHRKLAGECDQGIAALLADLKQRDMLKDTLVICSGEFGRTPTTEIPTPGSNNAGVKNGRDHNHHGFTLWMAGGGVKGGHIHGATDEFGMSSAGVTLRSSLAELRRASSSPKAAAGDRPLVAGTVSPKLRR